VYFSVIASNVADLFWDGVIDILPVIQAYVRVVIMNETFRVIWLDCCCLLLQAFTESGYSQENREINRSWHYSNSLAVETVSNRSITHVTYVYGMVLCWWYVSRNCHWPSDLVPTIVTKLTASESVSVIWWRSTTCFKMFAFQITVTSLELNKCCWLFAFSGGCLKSWVVTEQQRSRTVVPVILQSSIDYCHVSLSKLMIKSTLAEIRHYLCH